MIKRSFDIIVAALALVVFSPLLIVLAIIVSLDVGRPVLFVQRRAGLGGRPFSMYKFRTMHEIHDGDSELSSDERRVTRTGGILRRWSLDELPELINVLRGDMSLVGPRPLLMEYLRLYSPRQARRHEVRPGIAGWAQVNGRNAISWPEKFELDVWYVDNCSIWLDLKILFLTVWRVISGVGVSQPGHVTMPRFSGPEE